MNDKDKARFGLVHDPEWNPPAGPHYTIAKVEGLERFERGDDVLLVRVNEHAWVSWVLMAWGGCEADRSNPRYQVVMRGEGPSSSLREPRHTWVGNGEEDMEGYMFYVRPRVLAWAFDELRRWFDFDGDEP